MINGSQNEKGKAHPVNPELDATRPKFLKDDFEGKLAPFWDTKRIDPKRISFTEIDGIPAVQISVHTGDKEATTRRGISTERSEIGEPKKKLGPPIDNEMWYGFSFYLPKGFPIDNNRLVFAQWKQSGEGQNLNPILSFRYMGGKLIFQVGGSKSEIIKHFPIDGEWRGQWHRALVGYRLLPDRNGIAQATVDDKIIADYQGLMGHPIGEDERTYFKMGLYRDRADQTQTINFAHFRRGIDPKECTVNTNK